MLVGKSKQLHCISHSWHSCPSGEGGGRLREQLHRSGGDDAERAFAANHQITQVVTGVVFTQAT